MTEGNRQPLSQLQQELKEAKIKLENYSFPLDMEISELKQENERLKAALTQSIELIKIWKGKAIASSGKSKEIIEEVWLEYYDHSPDMIVIREVLGKEVGAWL